MPARVYAIDNHDPFSNANVIGRGIMGDLKGQVVVASPLYKQHFRLEDGQCLEDPTVRLRTWDARLENGRVAIRARSATATPEPYRPDPMAQEDIRTVCP